MNERTELSCIICDERGTGGILIYAELICNNCELEILQTDVKDERYPFFVNRMKQIWHTMNA